MNPLFGPHYRAYRLAAAMDRLRAMPAGTTLTVTKAAHLLGISEAAVRALVKRHSPETVSNGTTIGAATLRHVVRLAYEAHKER